MNKLSGLKIWNEYTAPEWMFIKISILIFWLSMIWSTGINPETIPYPSGIFTVVDGSFLISKHTVLIFFALAMAIAILYLGEKWMTFTTFSMFLLSLILLSLEESDGILRRGGLVTMIFLAQSIAYYRNNTHLKEERIQFPVQIIAAGYMLAGFSKLRLSGLNWIMDSPYVSIQILKGYCYAYFNTGDIKELQKGITHANFILENKLIIRSIFAGSLFLELFAWMAVKNKFSCFVYGLLLTVMHLGIFYFMHILISAIFYPMLFFMVNPLYLIYGLFSKLISGAYGMWAKPARV